MSLQIPSPSRPVSATVQQTSPQSRRQPPQHRASHQVVSSTDHDHQPQAPMYTDVYSHPAAVAYAAAHPRRTIPKFGPYLLLQTLGEGEFGKVKLGLHSQWGEEVAVKLIRRGNVDTAVRMSKVEREIEVLRVDGWAHISGLEMGDCHSSPLALESCRVCVVERLGNAILGFGQYPRFDQSSSALWILSSESTFARRLASTLFQILLGGGGSAVVLMTTGLCFSEYGGIITLDFSLSSDTVAIFPPVTLKHPNIVRLYDVIETDKYIGIIIEYASGGELFDHILAHRYLRERDASKLFSQLISGVWYIHQKKIVHRDLKLENLLLDRHRNVIITDFGFANRFEHRADDLMQTSCGSPCYAAPELVISEGLYVGSAVDIWSCGVILYAMLAGYLPFDDDPANPDGDNINLLYKYIVNTPLSFPEYISDEARSLLKMMLVPDPRKRASLEDVMRHPWLAAYHSQRDADEDEDGVPPPPMAFGKTVVELENAAMDQHLQKRQEYRRLMGRTGAPPQVARAQTTVTQSHGQSQNQAPPQRSQSTAGGGAETLYDSGAYGAGVEDDDPFGPGPGSGRRAVEEEGETPRGKGKEKEKEDKFRHTIQIEEREKENEKEKEREQERAKTPTLVPVPMPAPPTPTLPQVVAPTSSSPTPAPTPAPVSSSPAVNGADRSPSAASIAERRERRRRGSTNSVGGAAGKPLPPSPTSPPTTWKRMHEPTKSVVGPGEVISPAVNGTNKPAVMEVFVDGQKEKEKAQSVEAEKEKEKEVDAEKERKEREKKNRRNTLTGLTVMVNPINWRSRTREPSTATSTSPPTQLAAPPMKASTTKAKKVMQWIRKGRDSLTVPGPTGGVPSPAESTADSAETGDTTSPVQVVVTTPGPGAGQPLAPIVTKTLAGGRKPSDTTSPASATATPSVTESFASRFRRSINVSSSGTVKGRGERDAAPAAAATAGGTGSMRIHHGAMDQGTITTGQPPEVMRHVKEVLRRNGKSTIGGGSQGGVAAFTMVGSAGSNGKVDKRGLPLPSQSAFSGGGMLRGLLMRRQSSQVSNAPGSTSFDADDSLNTSGILTAEPTGQIDTVYGTTTEDAGDEVRFSVELTRLNLLNDTYSLDIRRLKGNLRSYKFLYDTLRKYAALCLCALDVV
ncbi:Non-specific serine/threonine protein kinase [Mycena sanguinolenta]|uniref:Non-specific serine/threonine protein kinase n=1 Tax=Mycena sanguinolenta TaxID=230812 RepID=A0A8H7DHD9_9AGAR|nr:Non-specific serine/threonine protein kinase [Mycena sanguinolenta]